MRNLVMTLEVAMGKLHRIWGEIGICESQQQDRSGTVMEHLCNLLDEMVEDEEAMKAKIETRIDKYQTELHKLTAELSLPDYRV